VLSFARKEGKRGGRAYLMQWVLVAGKGSDETREAASRCGAGRQGCVRSPGPVDGEVNGRRKTASRRAHLRRAILPWLVGRLICFCFFFCSCTRITTLVRWERAAHETGSLFLSFFSFFSFASKYFTYYKSFYINNSLL
jgi:hypothetical protein